MIQYDLPAGEYHAHPARSKSYLWKLYSGTPAHAEFGETETTPVMDLGTAVHFAALEPDKFESDLIRGPDDRRGNKWKDALEEAAAYGKLVLTSGDYDKAGRMGDSLRKLPIVRQLSEAQILREPSAFWRDEETGLECRCRPDIYCPAFEIMADLKTTGDASPFIWSKRAADMGYHAQEAWYTDGWQLAGGDRVEGFVFIVVETDYPHLAAAYELTPEAVHEGRLAMRKALLTYRDCRDSGEYPGYPAEVQSLDLPGWAYKETKLTNAY
jgi:exodeoxyribonuclease VIII